MLDYLVAVAMMAMLTLLPALLTIFGREVFPLGKEGALPNAVHIPRGHLESQVESRLADKTAPVLIYCAGGTRSAFAARTLAELGYTDVVSMAGGFGNTRGFKRFDAQANTWTVLAETPAGRDHSLAATRIPEALTVKLVYEVTVIQKRLDLRVGRLEGQLTGPQRVERLRMRSRQRHDPVRSRGHHCRLCVEGDESIRDPQVQVGDDRPVRVAQRQL